MTERRYSQNGFFVIPRSLCKTYRIGSATSVALRNTDAGWLLADLAKFIDQNVENIDAIRDDWGWADRNVRGSSSVISNHASGTAIDINATRHPRGKHNTWKPEQVKRIQDKLEQYDGCIRWGRDFHTTVDEMHFEIVVSAAKCTATAKRIRAERRTQ